MPLFSKSSTNGTISSSGSSGIGSSGGSQTNDAKAKIGTKSDKKQREEGTAEDGTMPKQTQNDPMAGTDANLPRDGSDLFSPSGTFNSSLNDGTSPIGSTTSSKMSSSFNQSSSYNRTFERKVIEESTPTMTTRMFTSSPLNTIKTTLGSGFPSDLGGLGTGTGTTFVQPHNYQFGTATSGSFHSSDDSLSVSMDCAMFAPEELKVSVVGNQIVVEGKHGEKQDSLGSIERQFVRKFAMPRNATADSVNSNLTSDGMLTVTASAPKAKDNSPIRTIPVKIVTTAAGGQTPQNGGGQFQQNGSQ
ncbi:hypothetical protein niasHT_030849 [Heterodera trifolii]|uniref:SHSP domain-containing protein n=1 Tax=Heterodera trifolii TaxID=157864 RepID=A0ABD2HXL0_9BILA